MIQAQQALEKIKALPLTKTTRNELVQYFHFGKAHYTTPQGLILDVGAYVLAVHCAWELQQPGEEPIRHSEVHLRKREAGLPSVKFDWKEPGATMRDQRLKNLVNQGAALLVEQAEVQDDHGFIILFANHAQLIATPGVAAEQEIQWQLFSNTGDDFSITVGAAGITEQ